MLDADVDDRVAILLRSLGGDLADSVLGLVPRDRASSLSVAIKRLDTAPPPPSEVADVLEEFNRFIEFALANSDEIERSTQQKESLDTHVTEFESTGDPFADLLRLENYQLAGAMRSETGPAIATVLRQLPENRVAEVVQLLPDDVRDDSFLRLQTQIQLPKPLAASIIESVVAKASLLDRTAASDPDNVAIEKTATLLRSVNRKTRTSLLAALEKEKPEFCEQVRGQLFLFDDLVRLTDKSVQRLLAEVESGDLAMALKNAEEAIQERITSNLSKRARASLLEEMEYLDSLSGEQEEAARKKICDGMAQVDQAGNLEMSE